MNNKEFLMQEKWDSSFLLTFKRPNINYIENNDNALLEAYRAGIYDATVNFIGESNVKVTGISNTIDEVKKFLRQSSFNGDLHLKDNHGNLIKTESEQEVLAETWFKEKSEQSGYTQFVIMIPKDNNQNKLSNIVQDFFQRNFVHANYVYVEHTDTNVFHYHAIVDSIYDDVALSKLQSNFINLCILHGAKLL